MTETHCCCCCLLFLSNSLLSYPLEVLSHSLSLPAYHAGAVHPLQSPERFKALPVHLSWVHLGKHFWKGLVKPFPRNPHCQVGGATLSGLFGLQAFFRASSCARNSPDFCSYRCSHPHKKQMLFKTQL